MLIVAVTNHDLLFCLISYEVAHLLDWILSFYFPHPNIHSVRCHWLICNDSYTHFFNIYILSYYLILFSQPGTHRKAVAEAAAGNLNYTAMLYSVTSCPPVLHYVSRALLCFQTSSIFVELHKSMHRHMAHGNIILSYIYSHLIHLLP